MSKPTIITATEASRNFADLLSRVAYGGESFVIKKGNREMARIGPVPVHEPEVAQKAAKKKSKTPMIELPEGVTGEEAEYLSAIMLAQAEKAEAD